MNATELASDLHRRGLSNTWLSVPRTKFLRNLALSDNERERRQDPQCPQMFSNQVWGELDLGSRTIGSWTMRISPVNGCGFFSVKTHDIVDLTLKSRKEAVEYAVNRAFEASWPGDWTIESATEAAHFLRWSPGYLSAAHEFDAWTTYEEAVVMVLTAWTNEKQEVAVRA